MPQPGRAAWSIAYLVAGALLLATCASAGAVRSVRVERDDVIIRPTPTPMPTFEHPLTGEVFRGPQPWQERPALAVKIDNSSQGRPQAGLHEADVVFEELAEGGVTRLVAVFQSKHAPRLGPVRSARLVDTDVLAPLRPLFGYAGGVPMVVSAVRSSSLVDVGYDRVPDAYRRIGERKAPYNLYTSTLNLWEGRQGSPPPPQFQFVAPDATALSGDSGLEASFTFSGVSDRVTFRYDPELTAYRRFHAGQPHITEDGTHVAATNVVIQIVGVRTGSIVDTNGQRTQETEVTGSGDVIVLTAGRALRGNWVRGSAGEPTRLVGADGAPLLLSRGTTWVELLPRGQSFSVG